MRQKAVRPSACSFDFAEKMRISLAPSLVRLPVCNMLQLVMLL